MIGARERILGRLRSAQPTQPSVGETQLDGRIDAHYAHWGALREATCAERIDAFEAALTAAHAEVWRASAATWQAHLAERIAQAGVRRLLLDTERPEGAALAAALPATVEPLPFAQPLEQWKAELFDTVEAGFTVALRHRRNGDPRPLPGPRLASHDVPRPAAAHRPRLRRHAAPRLA